MGGNVMMQVDETHSSEGRPVGKDFVRAACDVIQEYDRIRQWMTEMDGTTFVLDYHREVESQRSRGFGPEKEDKELQKSMVQALSQCGRKVGKDFLRAAC